MMPQLIHPNSHLVNSILQTCAPGPAICQIYLMMIFFPLQGESLFSHPYQVANGTLERVPKGLALLTLSSPNPLLPRQRRRRGQKRGGVAGGEAARHTPTKNPPSWGEGG